MLLVKAFTGPDGHGGTGLFAGEDIEKDAVVWRYSSLVTDYISVGSYFTMSQKKRIALQRYFYPIAAFDENPVMVGVMLDKDISRHSNHSLSPTTGVVPWDEDLNISLRAYYALRDIAYGEELTCNYLEFDPENMVHKMGIVTGKTFLISEEPFISAPARLTANQSVGALGGE